MTMTEQPETPTFGGFDRDEEDRDIRREGVVASGRPAGGNVLSQLREKFAGLDSQRLETFRVKMRNGADLWLELDTDFGEEDRRSYARQSAVGNREARRNGGEETSDALWAAALVNDKNTRLWFEDPNQGGKALEDHEGDPLTVHSDEWLAALGFERDPLGGLREALGDLMLNSLSVTYLGVAAGEGASVDPTPARSGD